MTNLAIETQHTSDSIRRHLPLLLFAITLIVFSLSLNYFLTSDNPRPDLAQTAAITSPADTVTGVLPLMSGGDDAIGTNWRPLSGDWIMEDGRLRQTNLSGFDQAIVYVSRVFRTYALDVTLRHTENSGGGVLFNMQSEDSLASSHLVRFESDGSALYWGYFDENGQFVGQGFAPITADLLQANRLVIKSHATDYEVWLNDLLLAENVPLHTAGGHVGLAVSQADVIYENISVLPIDGVGTAPAIPEKLIAQAETINGRWVFETDVVHQMQDDPTDYMLALNVLGKRYLLETTVDLGDGTAAPDNGAGFIFHMPDRATRAGAMMVRFMDHGQQILWGQFDENGMFKGIGNLGLELPLNQSRHLAVRVGAGSFDILIDGQERISDVPLTEREGWISLIAFRGNVTFSDINLNIGDY